MKMSFEGGRMRKEKSLEEQFDRGRGELGGARERRETKQNRGAAKVQVKKKTNTQQPKGKKMVKKKKLSE